MPLHTDAVPQYRPSAQWAGRIYGEHAYCLPILSQLVDHLIHHRALADSGSARDSNYVGVSGMPVKSFEDFSCAWGPVIDITD